MVQQTRNLLEVPEQSSRWVLWTIVGIVAVGLMLYFFPARESGVTRPVFGFAHPVPGSTLLATLSTNAIHDWDDKVALTLEASREASTQLGDLNVCVDALGFRTEPPKSCFAVTVSDRSAAGAKPVPTMIELIPVNSSGSYRVLLTATWTRYVPKASQPRGGEIQADRAGIVDCLAMENECIALTEKSMIPLGPVRIEIDRWGRFANRVTLFVKDLALPIILLVLGVQLNNLTAKRDRRRAAVEAAKEQIQKEQEREQDEDRQIVRILLPKVMDLASKYYLPMTWNAERFVMASAKGTDSTEELVFHLLNFFVVARALKEKAGGIFFKDLDGEKIFVNGNRILRAITVKSAGDETAFTYVLDRLAGTAPKERWPRLADLRSPKEGIWMRLEAWVKDLPEKKVGAIRYVLNALRGVLRYESNAPYFNWYHGTGAPIMFTLVEEIAEPDDGEFEDDLRSVTKELKATLTSYRERKKQDEEKQAEKDRREKEAEETAGGVGTG